MAPLRHGGKCSSLNGYFSALIGWLLLTYKAPACLSLPFVVALPSSVGGGDVHGIHREIRELLEACEYKATIYEREPVREEAKVRRMTPRERSQVERMSYPEQGYRRFRAERMTVI